MGFAFDLDAAPTARRQIILLIELGLKERLESVGTPRRARPLRIGVRLLAPITGGLLHHRLSLALKRRRRIPLRVFLQILLVQILLLLLNSTILSSFFCHRRLLLELLLLLLELLLLFFLQLLLLLLIYLVHELEEVDRALPRDGLARARKLAGILRLREAHHHEVVGILELAVAACIALLER